MEDIRMTQNAAADRFDSTEVSYRHITVAPMTGAPGAESGMRATPEPSEWVSSKLTM